jgi:hypothetical protein
MAPRAWPVAGAGYLAIQVMGLEDAGLIGFPDQGELNPSRILALIFAVKI